jgi:WD40 repeat protein
VRTWDVYDGKAQLEILQHSHDVLALAWRPDGKLLAAATLDGQISLWNAQVCPAGAHMHVPFHAWQLHINIISRTLYKDTLCTRYKVAGCIASPHFRCCLPC